MESLIELLQSLILRGQYPSEIEQETDMDRLRAFAAHVSVDGVVPPKSGATNAPLQAPADAVAAAPDPGPVATPVPPQEQVPPPTSPEVADTTPEATNAFSGVDPDLPGSP